MPKFDIPGRTQPTKVVLYRDNKERVYPLPFDATDPVDIDVLTAEGLEIVPDEVTAKLIEGGLTEEEAEAVTPAVKELAKPRPSRKEV